MRPVYTGSGATSLQGPELEVSERANKRCDMKVTVYFGSTRIVVPCAGDEHVAQLLNKATLRFKRAVVSFSGCFFACTTYCGDFLPTDVS